MGSYFSRVYIREVMLLMKTTRRREVEETEEATFGQDLKNELSLPGQGGEEREIVTGRRDCLIGLHSVFFPLPLDISTVLYIPRGFLGCWCRLPELKIWLTLDVTDE